MKTSLVQHITIPKIVDDCFLYFMEHPSHIPFQIRRIYFITSAHTKLPRGFHAHKKTRQVVFCIQGSIQLVLLDGKQKEEVVLDNAETGVIIDKMVWHEMHDFGKDTILLVLASRVFDPKDYIRDYQTFLNLVKR